MEGSSSSATASSATEKKQKIITTAFECTPILDGCKDKNIRKIDIPEDFMTQLIKDKKKLWGIEET